MAKKQVSIDVNLRTPLMIYIIGFVLIAIGGHFFVDILVSNFGDAFSIVMCAILLLIGIPLSAAGHKLVKEVLSDKLNQLKREVENAQNDNQKVEITVEKIKMPL